MFEVKNSKWGYSNLIMCFLWPRSAAQVQVWRSWQRSGVSILPDKYNGRRDGQGIWTQENGFKWHVVEFKLHKEGSKGMRRQWTGKHGRMKGLEIPTRSDGESKSTEISELKDRKMSFHLLGVRYWNEDFGDKSFFLPWDHVYLAYSKKPM